MMPRYQHYRCPECNGVFKYLHHPNDSPPPDRCELCHAWVSEDEPVFVPQAPRIKKSNYTKAVDRSYREIEQASIERADDAAGMLESTYAAQSRDQHDGLVRAQQKNEVATLRSELKITNMRDPSEMREGDTARIAPTGVTTPSFQPYAGSVSGAAVSEMVPTMQRLTRDHTPRAAGMIRAGTIGKY